MTHLPCWKQKMTVQSDELHECQSDSFHSIRFARPCDINTYCIRPIDLCVCVCIGLWWKLILFLNLAISGFRGIGRPFPIFKTGSVSSSLREYVRFPRILETMSIFHQPQSYADTTTNNWQFLLSFFFFYGCWCWCWCWCWCSTSTVDNAQ